MKYTVKSTAKFQRVKKLADGELIIVPDKDRNA